MRTLMHVLMLVPLLVLAAACGGDGGDAGAEAPTATAPGTASLPHGSEPIELDPTDFVAQIDNPYWPMLTGSTWVYRETDPEGTVQRVDVTVTGRTKTILGIEATVVHDVVTEDGELIEDTFDWYAQDTSGNVWYLGEATEEFENGEVTTTEGSWEAGVDGAQPGIIVPADPEVGMTYRQEYYAGEAEDEGEILSLDERAEVPFGSFDNVLMTKDTTPLDPNMLEHKFYAEGVGPILTLGLSGGGGREELIRYESGS
ncbi:MAG: hypothetical protein ACRDNR_01125 [Gaiellaceae bacterium]